MKWLIALLTAATGLLHVLIGFAWIGADHPTNWLLVLNGVGYLVLLWLFWTSSGERRGTIRWLLLAYALITLVGYFILPSGGFQNTWGLIVKAIELLLIILLFLDRGRDREEIVAPAPAATRTGAAVSSTAYQAAAGAGAMTTAATLGATDTMDRAVAEVDAGISRATPAVDLGVGAASLPDLAISDADYGSRTEYAAEVAAAEGEEVWEEGEEVVAEAGEEADNWLESAGDRVGDAVGATGAALAGVGAWVGDKLDDAGDAAGDAVDATGDALGDAGAWVGDKVDDAGDAMGDAVDATGDALSDAGAWVGDKVDDLGDATAATVDTTGEAIDATGAGAVVAAGASAEWVGDTGDAYIGEERSVAAGGAAEWVGETPDATGDLAVGAGMAAGAAAEWVGETDDALAGPESSMAAGGAAEWVGETPDTTAAQLRSELEEYLRSFGSGSEFRKGVEYVEGIGPTYGGRLRDAGVVTVLDLMVEGATRAGRKHLSDRSGISTSNILTWVNHIDLFRIKGVAQEYADLLEQSGVDTVVELAQRNPNNLFKRMNEINTQKELVRRLPHLSDVQSWVEQAKSLKRLIHY